LSRSSFIFPGGRSAVECGALTGDSRAGYPPDRVDRRPLLWSAVRQAEVSTGVEAETPLLLSVEGLKGERRWRGTQEGSSREGGRPKSRAGEVVVAWGGESGGSTRKERLLWGKWVGDDGGR
ncbi:hypothetical protein H0E87_027928, partial [Populus deltoides]